MSKVRIPKKGITLYKNADKMSTKTFTQTPMVPIHILLVGFVDTILSSYIKTLYFRYVRGDIAECFMNISGKVRDAIFSHV